MRTWKRTLNIMIVPITLSVFILSFYFRSSLSQDKSTDFSRLTTRQAIVNQLLTLIPENLLVRSASLKQKELQYYGSAADSQWFLEMNKMNVQSFEEDVIDTTMDKKLIVLYGYYHHATLVIFQKKDDTIRDVVWQSKEDILSDIGYIKEIRDINRDGNKEIILSTWAGGHGYVCHIYSWDGINGKVIAPNGDLSRPYFYSYRDATEFIDIDGDGIDEIIENSRSYPGVGPLSHTRRFYKWDGKNYMFWKEETKILEQKK